MSDAVHVAGTMVRFLHVPRLFVCLLVLLALAFAMPIAVADDGAEPDAPSDSNGPERPTYTLLTAANGGTYYSIGNTLRASFRRTRPMDLQVIPTQGSVSNTMMISLRNTDLAMIQFDVLDQLAASLDLRSMLRALRLVGPLYREEIHILVRKDAGIRQMADLVGRRVCIGAAGSGTWFSSKFLLGRFGIPVDAIRADRRASADALRALAFHEVDAAFFTGGAPLGFLSDLPARAASELELLDFGTNAGPIAAESGYEVSTIEAGTYPWQPKAVTTVATLALLVANETTDDSVVDALCEELYLSGSLAGSGHRKLIQATPGLAERLRPLSPIALHPASQRFFASRRFRNALDPDATTDTTDGKLDWKVLDPTQLERPAQVASLLTAQTFGTYHRVGSAMATGARGAGVPIQSHSSDGSATNLLQVAIGSADFCIAQQDVWAHFLKAPELVSVTKSIRLVTPLYHEEVHVIVRAESAIRSLADLAGKRLGFGIAGGGSYYTSLQLLQLGKVDRESVTIDVRSTSEALFALAFDELDAVIYVAGAPVDLLADIPAEAASELRLLDLGAADAAEYAKISSYDAVQIPAGTYPWQADVVHTLSTRALLLCRDRVPTPTLSGLVNYLMAARSALAVVHPKLGEFTDDLILNAVRDERFPLHPVARKHFAQLSDEPDD